MKWFKPFSSPTLFAQYTYDGQVYNWYQSIWKQFKTTCLWSTLSYKTLMFALKFKSWGLLKVYILIQLFMYIYEVSVYNEILNLSAQCEEK